MKKNGRKLTRKESEVLFGLVTRPNLSDSELAEDFGMPQPSFSIIKKRLENNDLIKMYSMPSFSLFMDCNIIIVRSQSDPHMDEADREETMARIFERHGRPLFYVSSNIDIVMLYFVKDRDSAEGFVSDLRSSFKESISCFWQEKNSFSAVNHDMSALSGFSFFYFSNLLGKGDVPKERQIPIGKNTLDLVDEEKQVLSEILKNPGINDDGLKAKIGKDVKNIPLHRRNLRQKGTFHRIYVPNISVLGFELLSFIQINFKKETDKRSVEALSSWAMEMLPIGFLIADTNTISILCLSQSYTHFNDVKNKIFLKLDELSIPIEKIDTALFPYAEMNDTLSAVSFDSASNCLLE